jgi:uncharacterized protein (DUF1330 family)
MAAYLLALVDVKDPEAYSKYTARTPDVIARYGGRFIVRNGEKSTPEGPEETRRMVIVEFDSLDAAHTFYYSDEYQEVLKLRQAASEGQVIIVDGIGG